MAKKTDTTSLSQITVNKKWLIEQIVANQATHEETYKRAIEGYRKRVADLMKELLNKVQKGEIDKIFISETPPTNHKREYKQVVAMLLASVNDKVLLSANEFASYVQDDWQWKQEWRTSVASNMVGSNVKQT